MSITDENSPSDEDPPSKNLPEALEKAIKKLTDKYELHDYVQHLTAYHTHHLTNETSTFKDRLLLQGLDNNDMYAIHNFLNITFDGELMKMANQSLTEKRAKTLKIFLDK